MKWETRYSSSEMMYVEVTATGVLSYLNSDRERATRYSFAQVLEGAADNEVGNVFGRDILAELKTVAQKHIGAPAKP
ncbi:MAG: hypothetical protein H8F28_02065 [Fibrella sp.]|nr:hypothetical protein [Armatimonadota bacterium]